MSQTSGHPARAEAGSFSVVVAPEFAGERLDRFFSAQIGSLSRSRIKSLIVQGLASRDGVVLREPAQAVQSGARYELLVPPLVAAAPEAQERALAILHEDDELIVLDKPAGLVVHPAPGNEDGTLVNALLAHCGDRLPGIGGERRPGIVHRLDKDTSGVMVVAKTDRAMQSLSAAFAARDVDRAYLALAWGLPNPANGEIEGAIGRDPRDRKRMAVTARGRAAMTRYQTLRTWAAAVSLLECRLATGRTHQIRVHLASRGHALVGDPVYLRRPPAASRLLAPEIRRLLLDFPRQALHAAQLGFKHPATGKAMAFQTAPPPDMSALLEGLAKGLDAAQQAL